MSRNKRPTPPSDYNDDERMDEISQMLRVDHAGEMAAVEIYRAQRKVFANTNNLSGIDMLLSKQEAEEIAHKKAFDEILIERGIRPTILEPIWKPAAQLLGYTTAFMGEKAAHACTAAVEEVIEQHYLDQEEKLSDNNPLKPIITKFRQEESEHRDDAIENGAEDAPLYPILSAIIKTGCKIAIFLSHKI